MRTNQEIISILKDRTNEKNISMSELARQVDMAKSAISRYFNGTREFPLNRVNDFARVLGLTPEYILGVGVSHNELISVYEKLNPNRQTNVYNYANDQLEEQNKVVQMPTTNTVEVYGAVSAGTGEYMVDNQPEEVDYSGTVPEHDFAVTVNGDSMTPLFDDKQIIFVKKAQEARSGQIVIADYDGQAYVKKFVHDNNGCRLVSLNKKYNDMPVNEQHEFSIFGIVIL
ncbi:Phage repressor protein C [Fructobacillus evanidus]|uniref:LexA family transcriptional regulator n=1 Tax=Fructobacillus evanidus TaxID=3064281 RepID=UPI002D8C5DFB|nr:Phage repressor protein C [Fructobacillus sp. LMG 32999]